MQSTSTKTWARKKIRATKPLLVIKLTLNLSLSQDYLTSYGSWTVPGVHPSPFTNYLNLLESIPNLPGSLVFIGHPFYSIFCHMVFLISLFSRGHHLSSLLCPNIPCPTRGCIVTKGLVLEALKASHKLNPKLKMLQLFSIALI